MSCWILRGTRLVAVVGDATTAQTLLPLDRDGWSLRIVAEPRAVDPIQSLLQRLNEPISFPLSGVRLRSVRGI